VKEIGKALTRKFGPAPAWVWLALFAVGMLIFRFLVKKPAPAGGGGPDVASVGPSVVAQPYPVYPPAVKIPAAKLPPQPPPPVLPTGKKGKQQYLSQRGFIAWNALEDWWRSGAVGSPPLPVQPAGKHHGQKDFTNAEYQAFQTEYAWYLANPYPTNTTPATVATSSTTDPTGSNSG